MEFETKGYDVNGISAVEIDRSSGVVMYDQSMRLDGQQLTVSSVEDRGAFYRYNLASPVSLTNHGGAVRSSFCGSTR